MDWRKSSYSGPNNDCVEVAMTWRKSSSSAPNDDCVELAETTAVVKSSYSTPNNACVELARTDAVVMIRNSKAPGRGTLAFPAKAVAGFVTACAAGELDDLAG